MTLTNFPKKLTLALVLLCGLSMEAANAQPGGGGGKRGGPPPEAFEACADKVSGDSCQVTGRRGEELQGSCVIPKEEDETLVCAPEGAPGRTSD